MPPKFSSPIEEMFHCITVCGHKERVKADLKRHLLSSNDRLQVHCVWCKGKEFTKRKAGDLKQHVRDHQRSIYRKAPLDCFGKPGCFYLAKFPKGLQQRD